jgi:hypothetical protein
VHDSGYRISNCDTVDGSNCKIVNGVNVRASGINSLYAIRREVTCRVLYTQHVTIYIYIYIYTYIRVYLLFTNL